MALSRPSAEVTDVAHDHGFHPLRVRRVIHETSEASSFVLDVPDELRTVFTYAAGQFCTFRVRVDGQTHLRCYSMSSAPAVDAELAVTVKRTPGGAVSNWMLDHVAAGDTLEVTKPAGVFCLTAVEGDIVAFSAGSGITPVHSLIKTALATTSRRVHLLYANQNLDTVIFGPEIEALARQHGDRLTVSHHLDIEHGYVRPETVRAFMPSDADCQVYICGPGPFMDIVEGTLLSDGLPPDVIHIERFIPADPVPEVRADPTEAATTESVTTTVTIELLGRTESTPHHPGTTILQTARQMGMSPPFSCEAGSCATCMAKLVTGTVEMYVNNALTDDEVADGWVLTCQAVPTSPVAHVIYSEEG